MTQLRLSISDTAIQQLDVLCKVDKRNRNLEIEYLLEKTFAELPQDLQKMIMEVKTE